MLDVIGRASVRKIEADHVHARRQHSQQYGRVAAGRTERGDDLGIALHVEPL
jgi:hypothetical protein